MAELPCLPAVAIAMAADFYWFPAAKIKKCAAALYRLPERKVDDLRATM